MSYFERQTNGTMLNLGEFYRTGYVKNAQILHCPSATEYGYKYNPDYWKWNGVNVNSTPPPVSVKGYYYHCRNGWGSLYLYNRIKNLNGKAYCFDLPYTASEDGLAGDPHKGIYNVLYGDAAVRSLKVTSFRAISNVSQAGFDQRFKYMDENR
jgi:hypothetical protein